MAQSQDISNSRFSNWSQHLDFGLFRMLAGQPTSPPENIDLGSVNGDKLPWQYAKKNPVNWPKMRKGIHMVVPSMFPSTSH
jgi:hypothetical protein